MFSRATAKLTLRGSQSLKSLSKNSIRSIVVSPAINDRPYQINPPVLPFGFDFVNDELRTLLESHNVDVEDLERQYNNIIQNDTEFNNSVLPSEGSSLWGYIYANRLIRNKVELNTLTKDEYFKRNYLRAQIEELETRLKRYYPNLDYQGEYNRELENAQSDNSNFEAAKNQGIAQLITSSDNGVSNYLSIFRNNSFINEYDETDKYNDFLPSNLESRMVDYFNYYYALSSSTTGNNTFATQYFGALQSLEKAVSTPLNAVTKELRNNFQLFMLDTFGRNDLDLVSSVLNVFSRASGSLSSNITEGSVQDCLNLLDVKSGKVNNVTADVLSRLFFGNTDGARSLVNRDVSEVVPLLSSASAERVTLVNRALALESALKQNSVSRVLLTVLLSLNRRFVGQFLTNPENIGELTSANSEALDNVIAKQRAFYKAQESLSSALNKFVDNLANSVAKDRKADRDAVARLVRDSLVSGSASANVGCVIVDGLNANASACSESGDVYGQLESLVYSNYLSLSGNSIGWYQLATGLLNPPRNGYSGTNLSNIANTLSNNSSGLSESLFNNIGNYLQQNGLLSASDNDSISNTLSTSSSADFESLRTVGGSFDQARLDSNNALHSLTLNVEGSFNFDNIVESYDPLNTYLSNYRYLGN